MMNPNDKPQSTPNNNNSNSNTNNNNNNSNNNTPANESTPSPGTPKKMIPSNIGLDINAIKQVRKLNLKRLYLGIFIQNPIDYSYAT